MIGHSAEVLSTREIVDRLLDNERSWVRPRLDYIQALEDVIHYDEQHAVRRALARLDGSPRSAVALLAGLDPDELNHYGGFRQQQQEET